MFCGTLKLEDVTNKLPFYFGRYKDFTTLPYDQFYFTVEVNLFLYCYNAIKFLIFSETCQRLSSHLMLSMWSMV